MKEVVRLGKNMGEPKKNKKQTKQAINEETPLTASQKLFCEEYVKTGNGLQSYKKSYTTCKKDETAKTNASRLLSYANVKKYIKELGEASKNDSIATISEVKEFWTNTIRNTEEKTKERIKASELLGKSYAMFVDKIESDVPTTINFIMTPKKRENK